MNFISDCFLLVIFPIILRMTCNVDGGDLPPFAVCPNAPTNLQTVHAEVYFNGCTFNDAILYSRICSWPFSDDDVSVTFKVGADVTFQNDKWICSSDKIYDCKCTFQYACLSQLLDQRKLKEFICCAQTNGNAASGVKKCITKYQLDQAVADCVDGKTEYDPKAIALSNAKAVLASGIDVTGDWEPYIFFEQMYDYCTANQANDWWAQSVCKMFTAEKFNQLELCKQAINSD